MIDWLSFVLPCEHRESIEGGRFFSVGQDGEVEWQTAKRREVRGSYDSALHIRTASHLLPLGYIEVSGNPVKWFQGHNLWGTDDVPALVQATAERLVSIPELGLTPSDSDRLLWRAGAIKLTRVDVTDSYHLATRSEVLAWLRAAEQTAHLSHRGRGQLVKGSTLYFGKHSRRWSLKLYSKGQEIEAKGHAQEAIMNLPSARSWADRTLRAELVLRGMELQRRCLGLVSDWRRFEGVDSSEVTAQLLRPVLGAMTMTTAHTLPSEVLDSFRPSLRMAFQTWHAGGDLRSILPTRTFYKFRAELLPHGIDIATLQPREASNVVPLVRVLEAVPASVPDWAVGTPLYFEPPRLRRIA